VGKAAVDAFQLEGERWPTAPTGRNRYFSLRSLGLSPHPLCGEFGRLLVDPRLGCGELRLQAFINWELCWQ